MQLFFKCSKIIILLLVFANTSNAQQSTTNPLLVHSNEPIRFDNVNVAVIHEAAASVIRQSDAMIKKITSVPANGHTYTNTLKAYDELLFNLNDVNGKIELISFAYTNDSIRNAADDEKNKIATYINNLNLDEGLYKAIKQFSISKQVSQLHPNQQKFLKETLFAFEKNGMKLDAIQSKQLAMINKKVTDYCSLFEKNVAAPFEYKDSFEFTKEELNGIDTNKIKQWKRPNGKYLLTAQNGFSDVDLYAENDTIRRNIALRYPHYRAYPENVKVLDSLLFYRNAMANLLGYRSYAAYTLEDKMAKIPANVWKFLNGLAPKLTEQATNELKVLSDLKHQLNPELSDTLYLWDIAFYRNKINTNAKYEYNSDEVKEYFEINNTVQAMFGVYEKLFDIQIKEIKDVPVWDAKVKYYELYSDGKKAGSFYMDLYYRQYKQGVAAETNQISYYNKANGKEILPVSVIVAKIKESNANQPTLLNYRDVTTIFHEFGHLVDAILNRSDISSQTGSRTKYDFVEAPALLMENWGRQYKSFKLITSHYKTGVPMPEALFNKMINANKFYQRSRNRLFQINMSVVDLTFYDKYDSIKGMDLPKVAENVEINVFPTAANVGRQIASFAYFGNEGANYYGYQWATVFAQDIFSVFEKNGIMDTKTGIRYKRMILEKGSSEEEIDMLRNFLGREPNSDAYLSSLGIK